MIFFLSEVRGDGDPDPGGGHQTGQGDLQEREVGGHGQGASDIPEVDCRDKIVINVSVMSKFKCFKNKSCTFFRVLYSFTTPVNAKNR